MFSSSGYQPNYCIQHRILCVQPCTTWYYFRYTVDEKRIVAKMPLKVFQERLIHNFDIRFKTMILNGQKGNLIIKLRIK